MNENDRRANVQLALDVIIREFVRAGVEKREFPSINALARACKEAGAKADKPLVSKLRRRAFEAIKRGDGEVVRQADGSAMIQVPLTVRHKPAPEFDPAKIAEERAEKKRRDDERAAEQAKRAAEREEEWARQRAQANEIAERAILLAQEREQAASVPPAPAPAPAPAPVRVAPRVRGTASERAARRQHLNDLLDAEPGMEPVIAMARLKDAFGVGLDWSYVYDTCRVAREIHGLPQIPGRHDEEPREQSGRTPLPVFVAEQARAAEERAAGATPEEDLAWLVRQLGDLMRAHGLASATVIASETGASWEFTEKPREPRKGAGEVKF